MATYDTPGAYIERADRAQGGIDRLRTDVAAFVGIAERGPTRRAVAVESWKQFSAIFGGLFAHGYLGYVVKAFFENGGRRCWVVRVEGPAAQISATVLRAADLGATPVWRVEANSSGIWGDALTIRLLEIRRTVRRAIKATGDWVQVDSVAGFTRAATVELIQDQLGVMTREQRILSGVDAGSGRLTWNQIGSSLRLPSDAPLALVDPAAPFRIETLAYQLQVSYNGRPWRVYDDLSLAPDHPRYGPKIANGVAGLFTPNTSHPRLREPGQGSTAELIAFGRRSKIGLAPEPVRLIELRPAPASSAIKFADASGAQTLIGGADGLSSLTAPDFIGNETALDDSDFAILQNRHGIAALREIDEISMVAVPDINIQPRLVETVTPPRCIPNPCLPGPPPASAPKTVIHSDLPPRFSTAEVERVMAALVNHCETRRDRVALIDPPFEASTRARLGVAAVRDFRRLFDSTYAALYFPWLDVRDELPQVRSPVLPIPPCGHIAGQIAGTDLRVGVHKAPANVPLLMAERATFSIDEATHGLLNLEGINVIRSVPGRGLRIAGARLVSSNSDFRFLNVRRLMLMIERSIEASIQWAVFEGNDWLTRAKLKLSIDSFLRELWSRGALMGASPEEAYFVRCDETNNPAYSRDRGELLIEVGVAPSIPFEFVVLRIGRSGNGFELAEASLEGV